MDRGAVPRSSTRIRLCINKNNRLRGTVVFIIVEFLKICLFLAPAQVIYSEATPIIAVLFNPVNAFAYVFYDPVDNLKLR